MTRKARRKTPPPDRHVRPLAPRRSRPASAFRTFSAVVTTAALTGFAATASAHDLSDPRLELIHRALRPRVALLGSLGVGAPRSSRTRRSSSTSRADRSATWSPRSSA